MLLPIRILAKKLGIRLFRQSMKVFPELGYLSLKCFDSCSDFFITWFSRV